MIRTLSHLVLALLLAVFVPSCEHRAPLPKPIGTVAKSPEGEAKFELVASYRKGDKNFQQIKKNIREGDLIALWMTREETRRGLFNVRLSALAYVVLEYGHLAIAVKLPDRDPQIRLYSSLPGIGSHFSGGLDELEEKNFRIFRLDRWDEVSAERLREFTNIARKKSRKVFGYDYFAAGGLWSDHLEPCHPHQIGGGYMCSTSVAAALHYAGLDLHNVGRCAAFQIVGPKKVFTSKGYLIKTPLVDQSGGAK